MSIGSVDGKSIELRHLSQPAKDVLMAALALESDEQKFLAAGGKGHSATFEANRNVLVHKARAFAVPHLSPPAPKEPAQAPPTA